jgi:ribosomal protein L40E
VHDLALVRLFAYVKYTAHLNLTGELAPSDGKDVKVRVFTDADWAGDSESTKSTNGLWIELYSPSSGRSFPLSWRSSQQTCSSSSTAEAETVSLSMGLRTEGFPTQMLFEEILGNKICLECLVDNSQAISAVRKGYSKKLRHLQRTHRVSISFLHEMVNSEMVNLKVEYCDSTSHKGDLFTKVMQRVRFLLCRDMIGMQ